MKTTTKLTAACLLAFAASASQAAVVTDWVYDIDMAWVTTGPKKPTFGDGSGGTQKVTATTISWGSAYGVDSIALGTPYPSMARSSLIITAPHASGSIATGTQVANVNMFTHTNNELDPSFADLVSATLRVSVDLSAASIPVQTLTKDFSVFFYETPNVGGTCAWGACSNDIFAFVVLPEISDKFTYDGQEYEFNYFQTSGPNALTQFSADVCSVASHGALTTTCYGFTTQESARTTLKFGLSVAPVPSVPEPESYAMLLAGLGMIGVVARRRAARR